MREETPSALQSSRRDACHLTAVAPLSTASSGLEKECHVRHGHPKHLRTYGHGHGHDPARNLASIHCVQDVCDARPT